MHLHRMSRRRAQQPVRCLVFYIHDLSVITDGNQPPDGNQQSTVIFTALSRPLPSSGLSSPCAVSCLMGNLERYSGGNLKKHTHSHSLEPPATQRQAQQRVPSLLYAEQSNSARCSRAVMGRSQRTASTCDNCTEMPAAAAQQCPSVALQQMMLAVAHDGGLDVSIICCIQAAHLLRHSGGVIQHIVRSRSARETLRAALS